ncbi:hypothetical protein BPAE_0189g00050 [Botrytis paeoniae]|uniref:Uncharacterized protein n=1 Tax=Botrytis paeoniae TaxID=278948 RepID=A0A4Z1FHC4_9HELO|nr:hypothetical protein BPAE_0189g00050 [Botrytis paeoniae]
MPYQIILITSITSEATLRSHDPTDGKISRKLQYPISIPALNSEDKELKPGSQELEHLI